MDRKRLKQSSDGNEAKKRKISKHPTALTLKETQNKHSSLLSEPLLSPVELFLCKFEERDDDSTTLSKLMQIEHLFSSGEFDPKQFFGFVTNVQKLAHRFSHNLEIQHILVRVCTVAARKMPTNSHDLKDMLFNFANSDSAEIRAVALGALITTSGMWPKDGQFLQECLRLATENVAVMHHTVRMQALRLLGSLAHCSPDTSALLMDLSNGCNDGDARVRVVSLDALLSCQDKGVKLNSEVYNKAKKACNDDFERVRLAAMKLVKQFAFQHPDWKIPLQNSADVELVLIDDAFIQVCDMINDWSVEVRTEAAKFLGEFHNVSAKFLHQTLDKKLMSGLKRVKSGHERQRAMYQGESSGDWNSGKQLVSVVPQLDLIAEEITLMNQGACGAFVHALEDEFKEVRLAAVKSMESLSARNKEFGSQCLDHLIDMFNDEIEEVRILSISSIRKIVSHIFLRDNQLDMVLGSLKDISTAMRHSLHSLLGNSKIPSVKGMQATVSALLENLNKYSNDKTSVWKCLRDVGGTHCELIAALVPSLLSTHPFLMTSEPNISDPAYICILILVFNACASCPTIPALFPSHVYRHYLHLRDLLPDLVPDLKLPCRGRSTVAVKPDRGESAAFLLQMLEKCQFALSLVNPEDAKKLLQSCIRDLTHVADMDHVLRPSALFSAMFWQCQLLLLKISRYVRPNKAVSLRSETGSQIMHNIEMIEKLSYKMEHTFCGLSDEVKGKLCLLRMIAESVALLFVVRLGEDVDQGLVSDCVLVYTAEVQHLASILARTSLPTPSCINDVNSRLADFTVSDSTKLQAAIFSVVESFKTLILEEGDTKNLRMISVDMQEPQSRSQNSPLKFLASLALSLQVHLKAFNFEDLSSLLVQATMPDGEMMLFKPKPSDWHSSDVNEDTLQTSIVLSHGPWTDPCSVEIGIVQVYTCDSSETKYRSVHQCVQGLTSTSRVKMELGTSANVGIIPLTDIDSLEQSTISLCKPICLYIHPLPEQGR